MNDRLVQGTVKFGGGSLMFWGSVFWEGIGYGTEIDGRMHADLFVSILEDELQQSLEYYNKRALLDPRPLPSLNFPRIRRKERASVE